MSRAKVDPKKEEQDRLAVILQDLLKEEENKYCADCNAKTPRWASWNLGVFICITCAGIHRNLGVHISKVRSVNLDAWTAEQVQSMRVMGNEKAKRVYEHSLPPTFRRPMAVHQLEQFIRAKYDQKRYILKDFVYPKIDANDLPKPGAPSKNTVVIRDIGVPSLKSPPTPSKLSSNATVNVTSNGLDLLDFSTPSKPTQTAKAAPGLDLFADDPFGSSQPVPSDPSNDMDDMFGNFVSAAPAENEPKANILDDNFASFPPTTAPAVPEASNALTNDIMGLSLNEPSSSTSSSATEEKKSNADILSLFSNSSNTVPPQLVVPGGFAAFGIQAAPTSAAPQPSLNIFDAAPQATTPAGGTASLLGLNFGGPAVPSSQQPTPLGSMMNTMPNMSQSFPNPFGAPTGVPSNLFPGSTPAPLPTQNSSGFSTPAPSKATNSFADFSIGNVMGTLNNMGYKQNTTVSTKPTAVHPTSSAAPAVSSNSMNFDDLLGL